MKQVTGIDLVHVPYTGGATAMSDLLAGRVELLIADIPVICLTLRPAQS
jgi:tripartite-type tricarboxylate transporter receptor subunit TctC